MILPNNGCIHTMEQDFFKNGYLLIDGAKISAVGDMKDLKDVNADQVYDLEGAFVMPGMVDGHSHIGMWEDSLGFEGADGNEAVSYTHLDVYKRQRIPEPLSKSCCLTNSPV